MRLQFSQLAIERARAFPVRRRTTSLRGAGELGAGDLAGTRMRGPSGWSAARPTSGPEIVPITAPGYGDGHHVFGDSHSKKVLQSPGRHWIGQRRLGSLCGIRTIGPRCAAISCLAAATRGRRTAHRSLSPLSLSKLRSRTAANDEAASNKAVAPGALPF